MPSVSDPVRKSSHYAVKSDIKTILTSVVSMPRLLHYEREEHKMQHRNYFFSYTWVLFHQSVSSVEYFLVLSSDVTSIQAGPFIWSSAFLAAHTRAIVAVTDTSQLLICSPLEHKRREAARKGCASGAAIWRAKARQPWIFHGGKHAAAPAVTPAKHPRHLDSSRKTRRCFYKKEKHLRAKQKNSEY